MEQPCDACEAIAGHRRRNRDADARASAGRYASGLRPGDLHDGKRGGAMNLRYFDGTGQYGGGRTDRLLVGRDGANGGYCSGGVNDLL